MTVRTVAQANFSQCCGPADCGYRNPDDGIRYCTATACMGWRWSDPYQLDAKGDAHRIDRKADSKTGPLRAIHAGYCGLAGKP